MAREIGGGSGEGAAIESELIFEAGYYFAVELNRKRVVALGVLLSLSRVYSMGFGVGRF